MSAIFVGMIPQLFWGPAKSKDFAGKRKKKRKRADCFPFGKIGAVFVSFDATPSGHSDGKCAIFACFPPNIWVRGRSILYLLRCAPHRTMAPCLPPY